MGIIAAGFIILMASIIILLQNSRVQNYIAQNVVENLSETLNTTIEVDSVYYKFFNTICVKHLYVEDLQSDTLLFVDRLDLRFSLLNLLKGQILIRKAEMNAFQGNLSIDSTGVSNFDFILKAFSKPKEKPKSHVVIDITKLSLKNSSFSLTSSKASEQRNIETFNPGKFRFEDINTDISFNFLTKDSICFSIKEFSGNEQFSNLKIKNIEAEASYSASNILVPLLQIELANSLLKFDPISVSYDSVADLRNFNDKVNIRIPIAQSNISLSDLGAFVPELKPIKGLVTLSADLSGHLSNLKLKNLKINYGKDFILEAGMELIGLPNIDETFIFGDINNLRVSKNDLQDFLSGLNRKPVILPKELNHLGIVQYRGKATGFFSDLVVFGNLSTHLGNVSTDLKLQFSNKLNDLSYNGIIKSKSIQLGSLIGQEDLGNVAFSVSTKGYKQGNSSLQGTIQANVSELQFHEYSYEDINFDGAYDGNGFDGKIIFEDENLKARFDGIIDLQQKLPFFDFALTVDYVDLYALKLTESYPNSSLSFKASTNMTGNSFDNINGFLRFDSLQFSNQGKTLNVDTVFLRSEITENNSNLSITSDYLNASLKGNFLYSNIGNTLNSILGKYLPAVSKSPSDYLKEMHQDEINIDIKVENLNTLADVLRLPYSVEGISTIKGKIDGASNQINITAAVPALSLGNQRIESFNVELSNINQKNIELTCRTQYLGKDGLMNFFLNSSALNNIMNTRLGWQNAKNITYAGDVNTETKFEKANGSFFANMDIKPTKVIIADSTWTIHPGKINWNADNSIQISNLKIDNHNQFIHIVGKASKEENDRLNVTMNKLNVDFILSLLRLKGFKIGGIASGKVELFNLFTRPIYEADIHVDDVKLNDRFIGNADLFSTWDKENEQICASGSFYNDNRIVIEADGVYVPKKDSLDFIFDAKDVSIEFLSRYFDGVAENVQGLATGKVRMYGPSKSFGFDADAFVRNGQATISLLKTTYTFNDYVYLRRNLLEVKNFHLYDSEKNLATANGQIKHDGLFSDMNYDFLINSKNIMAINTQSKDNEYFFGKAYVDGNVRIFGDMNETNIVADAVSKPRSKVYVRMASMSTASDKSFIKFVDKNVSPYAKAANTKDVAKKGVNVKVNLQVEATPDAEIELITDPKAGDVINAKGSGNLRVEFDTYSDIKLFGTYTIENGYYLFSLQDLIRKDFRIEQGSSISWSGDMKNANVNIKATYSLSASLLDLMDKAQVQLTTSRSNIPVNCVLKLTDNLMSPTIAFGIELPSSDESVKQYVRSIISTEEMMNRQILFLLLLGRFYTPDYMSTADASTNTSNEGLAFATATINGWLSKLIQSSKFSLGFDIRTDEQTSQYQTEIHYQPNNRLIVNGNIGYQQDELAESRNRLIGDLDMEYLLTESGKLRFKGYSHTVDRLGTAKISYGAGFLYKEEFKSVKDLFNYYWLAFNSIWKKNPKEEKQDSSQNNSEEKPAEAVLKEE